MNQRIRVVFIGGYGRSGSTLLERILGQIDQVCCIGELCHIWERGYKDNQLCGCGEHFSACPFWNNVEKKAFNNHSKLDIPSILALQRSVNRLRYIPYLLSHHRPRGFQEKYKNFSSL